ncbi:MAG: ATP-binding cassette domain-containing protein, partial [Veillonella sp.]|nr:ATP-binding cassette domain-containing protein [Veillonella sp.]
GAAFHTGMAGKTSILKYEEFMNRPQSLPLGGDSKLEKSIQEIAIKDLTFTYENSENGVHHITLEAERNVPIMLVGESGAGKSTIAHIIGGFLQAPKGTVTIDGIDICDLDIDWWRQQITYVSQHPHIMKGTLREVLSFGMDVSDAEILDACKEVQLLDVINRQQDGLDAVIGEGGLGLSGGERQRIALARAFLRKGQVLILDEVTAHLDVKTEAIISTAIQRLMENKIVIIIGHRLQTMHWASKLYVLKNGLIIQEGSYHDLLQEEGYFKELVTSGLGQFSATLEEPLYIGKQFDSENTLGIDTPINGTEYFDKSVKYTENLKDNAKGFNMGIQGWKLLFSVLSPAKWSLVLPLAPAILKRFGAGDMLGRIMGDIEVLQFFYLRTLIPPVAAIALTVLIAYGASTIDNSLITPILLSALALGVILPLVVYAHNKQSLCAIGPQQGDYKALLSDTMDSIEDVISYGNEDLVYNRIQHMMRNVDIQKSTIDRGMNMGNTLFIGGVQLTVVIVAIMASDILTGAWASVMVAVAAIGTQAWFEALQPMIAVVHHGAESKVATSRLMALSNEPISIVEPISPKSFNPNDDIIFTDVSFGYDEYRHIYENLRLHIQQGQSIAIVGASGSGKTTLFNMLERLYDYGGSIRIGAVELKDLSIDTWRNALGTITQDTYIFNASFEDNIRFARPEASKEDLEQAINRASLRSVVEKLPEGMNTIVGSGGHGLSGGERQRIALARLFLRNPQIVLLDEPLEGLDQVTRKALHRDLMHYVDGKTCLYITHQLEGLEQMDRILFMNRGQIVEDGTYEELIALRGRFYEYCYLSMASIQ